MRPQLLNIAIEATMEHRRVSQKVQKAIVQASLAPECVKGSLEAPEFKNMDLLLRK
jgi:hypothetical protein